MLNNIRLIEITKAWVKENGIEKTVDLITKIGTIGAGIFAVVQLNSQLNMQRKDQNMQLFIKQYEDEKNIGEIRSNLYNNFDLSNAYNILTEEVFAKEKYQGFIIKEFAENNTEESQDRYQKILILANYYNGIASCVESNLCDKETAKVLFKTEGSLFFKNYYPFFCHLNQRWQDRMVTLESIEFYGLEYEPEKDEAKKDFFPLNLFFPPQKKSYYEYVCRTQLYSDYSDIFLDFSPQIERQIYRTSNKNLLLDMEKSLIDYQPPKIEPPLKFTYTF